MNEREMLARFNSLLSAGLSLQQAERISKVDQLDGDSAKLFRFFKSVSLATGASPVLAMERLQQLIAERNQAQSKVRLAIAGPRATARLVTWLPLAALLIGQLGGLGSIEIFWRAPWSLVPVALGGALLLAASIWSAKMIDRLVREPDDIFVIDALAICLQAGLPVVTSLREVNQRFADEFDFALSNSTSQEISQLQQLSEDSGLPIAKLLFSRAEELRQNIHHEILEAIEKLQINLLWPLGLFVLPAFVLIAVLPMSISLLTKG